MINADNSFDPLARSIDWLDACRARQLDTVVDFYDDAATIECNCDGTSFYKGRAEIAEYWRPKLSAVLPSAFDLDEIYPTSSGVILDYQNFEGKVVRISFRFNEAGKIVHTRCGAIDGAETPRTGDEPSHCC